MTGQHCFLILWDAPDSIEYYDCEQLPASFVLLLFRDSSYSSHYITTILQSHSYSYYYYLLLFTLHHIAFTINTVQWFLLLFTLYHIITTYTHTTYTAHIIGKQRNFVIIPYTHIIDNIKYEGNYRDFLIIYIPSWLLTWLSHLGLISCLKTQLNFRLCEPSLKEHNTVLV